MMGYIFAMSNLTIPSDVIWSIEPIALDASNSNKLIADNVSIRDSSLTTAVTAAVKKTTAAVDVAKVKMATVVDLEVDLIIV